MRYVEYEQLGHTFSVIHMKLYKFMKSKYALSSLKEQRLKISRIDELNDPFEVDTIVPPNDCLGKELAKLMKEFSTSCGLISFSKEWNNPVQWAHYADGHKGICLGFDFKDDTYFSADVEYVDERPLLEEFFARHKILAKEICAECERQGIDPLSNEGTEIRKELVLHSMATNTATHEQVKKYLYFTKFRHWQYEDEFRILVPLGNKINKHFYLRFADRLRIRTVILGLRSKVTKKCVLNALGCTVDSVDIFKVHKHKSKYEMVKNDNWN